MNVPVNVGGQSYDLTVPDGTPQDKIDARIKELGGFQERSWGEWATRLIVPQTPAEWGIALATLPLGFGAGGAAGRALTIAGRPLLGKLAGGAVGRLATLGAGGALGAAVGEGFSEEAPTTSVGSGFAQGLLAGLAGEGAGVLLKNGTNLMMRNFIRKVQNPEALAAYQKLLLPGWAQALQTKAPAEAFTTVMSDVGEQTRGSLLRAGIDQAEKVATAKGAWTGGKYLPDLASWMRSHGFAFDAPLNDMFTLSEAMDGYMRIGPTIYREGFSRPGAQDAEKQFRAWMTDQLYTQMGPDAAKVMQTALHQNAVFKQWTRFLKSTPEMFLPNGGLDFGPAQDATFKMFLGQDAKTLAARQKLGGDMTEKLVDVLWRGGQPLSARDINGGIGFSLGLGGHPRIYGIRAPSFAGDPLQVPPGMRAGMGAALTLPATRALGGIPSALTP